MPTKFSSPRGTLDYLPPESVKLLHAEAIFRFVCENYCYQPVRTPTFESTELFARGEGESSDIVSKEMYTFPDKKGRSLTLRPEGTPGVVRAMIQAGWNFNDLTRVYYVEPMFRYQRPQKGRYREHTQVGVEILGAESVTADVEVISLGVNFLKELGLENLRVAINTVGSAEDRKTYNVILKDYIDKHSGDFCPDCHFRAEHNPMRVFDCKVKECHAALLKAPGIFDSLSTESRERFENLKNMLSAENIIFDEDFTLVRGLDYYTHTVFEVMMKGDEGQQSSLMGGGRYDGLVELYGGPATPAMGFGCGLERVIEAMDWSDVADLLKPTCDIALIALGERALTEGTRLADELRNRGISVHIDHRKSSMKNQMGQANTLNAALAIIIGDNELDEGKVILKDMETGEQEAFDLGSVVEYLAEAGETEGDE